ncbi:MAG: 4'-phosphopantetheinyl transferase superfamily protein [Acidobacteriia bacterium]|nr:4'-phosphopantetheinyl transferase superfamily protein [Terriglobia bacterium]
MAAQQCGPGDVHVWMISPAPPLPAACDSWAILSAHERSRAERFHFEADRQWYVARHYAVRSILSGYVDAAPSELVFGYGEAGKPELTYPPGSGIRQNLSHASSLAVLAVTRDEPVGVDIERKRPVPEACDIARRMFSEGEYRLIAAASGAARDEAFLRCWTCKEAVVKATGQGITAPLQSFDVGAAMGGAIATIHLEGDGENPWVIASLAVGPEHIGAVVRRGTLGRVEMCTWGPEGTR